MTSSEDAPSPLEPECVDEVGQNADGSLPSRWKPSRSSCSTKSMNRPLKHEESRTPGSSAATTPVMPVASPREGLESSPALTALDQAFEDDFQKHLKKSNKLTRFSMGAVGAGIGGAVGFFASPVVIPGLVIAGIAGGAGGYQWSKRQGKKLLQKHGAGGKDGTPSVLQSQRPSLRRLRYLAKWGSWQFVEYASVPDSWRAAVLHEVVRGFSPWVQALFLVRARAGGGVPETDAEAQEIFQHLAPLYQWLQKKLTAEVVIEACSATIEAFKAEAVEGEHAELCRIVFPTILETISIMDRLAPATHAKLAEDVAEKKLSKKADAKRSKAESDVAHPLEIQKKHARQRLRDIVQAIREVLEDAVIVEALANPAEFERLSKNPLDKDDHLVVCEEGEEECSGDGEDDDVDDDVGASSSSIPKSPTKRKSGRVQLVVPPEGVEEVDEAFLSCGEEEDDSDTASAKSEASKQGDSVVEERSPTAQQSSGDVKPARFEERSAALPKGSGTHEWDIFDASKINVRSATYLKDRKKAPSAPALLELVSVDMHKFGPGGPVLDPVNHRDFYPYHHYHNKKDNRFLFIQNWIVPPFQALLIGAVDLNAPWLTADTPQARCWNRFLNESPEDQKKSFKVMCFVEKAPWLVARATPKKPVLVGKQLKMVTKHEPGKYIMVTLDVCGGGKADQMAVSMVMKSLSRLQIILACMIEGKQEEELPETLLMCASLQNTDTSRMNCPVDDP